MFASKTLGQHVVRGVLGFGALAWLSCWAGRPQPPHLPLRWGWELRDW
jgi:hypothetical protein